jgi:hypothetical protein
MKMKKILLSLISLLLLIPIASAQVYVSPETFEISLVGGESIVKNFTVEWKGEAPVVGYLNYSVKQLNGTYDGKELWINFSQDKVILEPNKPENLQIFICTLPNIQPDTYTLEISVRVNVEKPETITKTEYLGGIWIKYQNVTIEKEVPYIPLEINETIEFLQETLRNQTDLINKLNEILREREADIERKEWGFRTLLWVSVAGYLVILALFIFTFRKQIKSQSNSSGLSSTYSRISS